MPGHRRLGHPEPLAQLGHVELPSARASTISRRRSTPSAENICTEMLYITHGHVRSCRQPVPGRPHRRHPIDQLREPDRGTGSGGVAAGGRKGAPYRVLGAGERVVLADVEGPGTIRHVWMTFPPAEPEVMRAKVIEVFYDGARGAERQRAGGRLLRGAVGPAGPPDHGPDRHQRGPGFNSYLPMPFRRSVRVEFVNAADRPTSTSRSTTRSSRTWRRQRATCTRCSGGRTGRGCAATSSSPTG